MVSLRHARTLPFYMTGHGRRYTSHHKHTCLVSRTGAYYIYLKRRESLNSCFITIIITTYVILQLMCQLMRNAMKMYQVSLLYTTTLTTYVASLTAQQKQFLSIANLLTSVKEISKTSRTFLPHYLLGRSSPFSFPIYYSLQDDLFQVITSFKMAKILELLFLYKGL